MSKCLGLQMQFIEMNLPERGKNRSWRTILVLSAFQSVLNSSVVPYCSLCGKNS